MVKSLVFSKTVPFQLFLLGPSGLPVFNKFSRKSV